METKNHVKPYLTKTIEARILNRLKEWENKKLYLNPSYKINDLAKELGFNTKYISFVINRNFSKNYSGYINSLRLNHLILLINELDNDLEINLTSLVKKVGFSTYLKFSHFIKSTYKLPPLKYIESIRSK